MLNKDISPSKISRKETTVFGTSTEIITLLFRAYPQPFSEPSLSIGDRITILAGIVSVLSELGFYRKKALILKEIMAALLPALVQARKDGAAEMGVHPAASLASLNTTVKSVPVDKAGVAFDESEQGIHHFLSLVCRAYGVFLQEALGDGKNDESATHGLLGTQSSSKNAQLTAIRRVLHDASNKASGAQDLKIDILRSCINMCEALPDLGGVLWYSAQLLRTAGSGIAPGPDSSDGSPDLPIEEQIRLATNISRTLSAAKHLGIRHLEAEYWDEFLVREIEVVDTSYSSLVAHAKSEIEIAEFTEAEEEKNPFIYNPFLKVKASIAAEPLLVAHEQAFFRVTLQNLFDFDINIERIALVSDVLAFNSLPQATMIGPYRTQTILLSGTPQSSGTLSISGCTVKIKGCRERNFAIFNEPWALKPDVKGRHVGLPFEGRPVSIASDSGKGKTVRPPKGPTATTLTLSVTSAQPIITLKSISLPQSAIMILEGETQVFSVTLQNTSETIPVDLLLLSFSDSTASRMQSTLSNKELVPVELYELELAAERTQSFRWHRKHVQRDIFIRPGEEATFEIEVLGRPGLSWGKIEVDYGHLGIPKAEVKDRFYTRQLVIPLTVTVNASVDLMRNDVVSFSSSIALQHHQTADKANGVVSKDPAGSEPSSTQDHYHLSLLERISLFSPSSPCCLFLLDLRNSWPSTLTVFIEVHLPPSLSAAASSATDKVALYKHSQILHPGTTHRSPLPISRLYHPDPHAPIPTLNAANKRQFVVSAINSAPQAERCMREAFWYREALLGQVKATWREESTGRTGDVELRGLRLTPRMISALKLEDLAISMSVSLNEPDPAGGNEDERVKQVSTSRFSVPTSSFLSLSTTLHNRSTTPIHPLLRLQPALANQPRNIALDLGKKLLVDGVLQRALPVLEPGGTRTVETGFCVLARGTYEWGASVEEVRARGNVTGHGNIEGVGGRGRARTGELAGLDDGGRRTWVAEENCVVVADNQ